MEKRQRIFRIILIILLAVCGIWIAISRLSVSEGSCAVIKVDGRIIRQLPLAEDTVVMIDSKNNISLKVIVDKGSIFVEHSDCPDKICEQKGRISKINENIICLPARTVIEIQGWIEYIINIPMVIPGIKLGLANIVILFTLCTCSKSDALYVLIGRLLLNALLFGNISSLMYSVCGGLLSFAVMCLAMEFIKLKTTAASILGGISHNIGQLTVACLMMNTSAVWVYLPYLIIGGTLAGMLNGMMVRKISALKIFQA